MDAESIAALAMCGMVGEAAVPSIKTLIGEVRVNDEVDVRSRRTPAPPVRMTSPQGGVASILDTVAGAGAGAVASVASGASGASGVDRHVMSATAQPQLRHTYRFLPSASISVSVPVPVPVFACQFSELVLPVL
jgi:hypothetical protein